VLLGHTVELRRTEYDLERASVAIRASGFPGADDFVSRYLIGHPSRQEVAELFEKMALERAQPSADRS
jgi:hypothetical protein